MLMEKTFGETDTLCMCIVYISLCFLFDKLALIFKLKIDLQYKLYLFVKSIQIRVIEENLQLVEMLGS